jgi:hypothetical protein
VELPAGLAAPSVEKDDVDPVGAPGVLEVGAPLGSVGVAAAHDGVLPVGVAGTWIVAGGSWQVGVLLAGTVASLDPVAVVALGFAAVCAGSTACGDEATEYPFFAPRRR